MVCRKLHSYIQKNDCQTFISQGTQNSMQNNDKGKSYNYKIPGRKLKISLHS